MIGHSGYAFFAGRADLNRCTRTRGPKPLKKAIRAASLQSSLKILISRPCETKLGLRDEYTIWHLVMPM